jgi:RNA polymerase sigma factor (sigma-70 family)
MEALELGDEIEALLTELGPRLNWIIASFKIPRQDAEDLRQQALLLLVSKWRDIQDPLAWLVGTLRQICLLHLRSEGRRLRQIVMVDATTLEEIAGAAPSEHPALDMRLDLVNLARALPARQQRILRCYCLGLMNDETAQQLGLRYNSVVKGRKRAIRRLGELQRDLVGEERSNP